MSRRSLSRQQPHACDQGQHSQPPANRGPGQSSLSAMPISPLLASVCDFHKSSSVSSAPLSGPFTCPKYTIPT
ncbi:hypothetical protein SBV1_100016 [Verrucomicrobia bacterium]|nr:hypothetical protein SBV1_100016 [Verrucomicrobiota bacterium]